MSPMKLPQHQECECSEDERPESESSSNDGASSQSEQSELIIDDDVSGPGYYHVQHSQDFLHNSSSDVDIYQDAIEKMIASPVQTYEQLLESFSFLSAMDITQFQAVKPRDSCNQTLSTHTERNLIHEVSDNATVADEQLELLIVDCDIYGYSTLKALQCCILAALTDIMEDNQQRPRISLQVDNFFADECDETYDDATPSVTDVFKFDLPAYSVQDASFLSNSVQLANENDRQQIADDQFQLQQEAEDFSFEDDVINVEPFVLDAEFDYDAVRLSSKYTSEELNSRHGYSTVIEQ